jgi:hypothetical protein
VGSVIKVNFGKLEGQEVWFQGVVMSYTGGAVQVEFTA